MMKRKSSSLKQRILTAAVLAPPVLAITFFAPSNIFAMLLILFLVLAVYEWGQLSHLNNTLSRYAYMTLVVAIFLVLIVNTHKLPIIFLLYLATLWWILLCIYILTRKSLSEKAAKIDFNKLLQGVITLIPAFVAMFLIHQIYGAWMIFYLFLIIWGADIGAYFSGKRFGKNKLAPVLSPGKTIEGVIGGLVLITVLSFAVSIYLFDNSLDRLIFVILAIVIVCFSIVGDLYESLLKREAGVKDSSQILPGHGGVLDRIDSLLAAAPLFLLFYSLYYSA